jgi:hypothetical protein
MTPTLADDVAARLMSPLVLTLPKVPAPVAEKFPLVLTLPKVPAPVAEKFPLVLTLPKAPAPVAEKFPLVERFAPLCDSTELPRVLELFQRGITLTVPEPWTVFCAPALGTAKLKAKTRQSTAPRALNRLGI